jgi:hypothetical protein
MSIQQALQLSYASRQFGTGYFDRPLGSAQIVGGHLVPLLAREQATLLGHQSAQLSGRVTADALPFTFAGLRRQLARALSALFGIR